MTTEIRKLLGKIIIEGQLVCLTGLHIGASNENLEIGAVDSPVVRDPLTMEPYIPGSSLKGKLRSLLEKAHPELEANRDGGSGIKRHECESWEKGDGQPGAPNCPLCRLFGSTGKKDGKNYPSRLKVRDLKLTEKSREELENIDTGILFTELKFENSIDRVTSAANPRNLERIPRGATFSFSIVYDVEDTETVRDDLDNLQLALDLLQDDALGGHGSRGYGHVKIELKDVSARKIEYYRNKDNEAQKKIDVKNPEAVVQFFKD